MPRSPSCQLDLDLEICCGVEESWMICNIEMVYRTGGTVCKGNNRRPQVTKTFRGSRGRH